MGRINLILSALFIACMQHSAAAYNDTALHLTQIKFFQGTYTDFYVDNLNNIYLVSPETRITKIDERGDSAGVFNSVRKYGDLFSLDVTNPLKLVLYYKDFATILILDRFLNAVNTIDLRKLNILQATAVALSYDNNYWVFDELNNSLKKLDDNSTLLFETADFRTLFTNSFTPENIIDNNGFLYVYDAASGWLIFDYYGAFKKHIPAPDWKNVYAENKFLKGHDERNFYTTNTENNLIQIFQLPAHITPNNVFLRNPDSSLYPADSMFKEGLQQLPSSIAFTKAIWQANRVYVLRNDGLAIFTVQ